MITSTSNSKKTWSWWDPGIGDDDWLDHLRSAAAALTGQRTSGGADAASNSNDLPALAKRRSNLASNDPHSTRGAGSLLDSFTMSASSVLASAALDVAASEIESMGRIAAASFSGRVDAPSSGAAAAVRNDHNDASTGRPRAGLSVTADLSGVDYSSDQKHVPMFSESSTNDGQKRLGLNERYSRDDGYNLSDATPSSSAQYRPTIGHVGSRSAALDSQGGYARRVVSSSRANVAAPVRMTTTSTQLNRRRDTARIAASTKSATSGASTKIPVLAPVNSVSSNASGKPASGSSRIATVTLSFHGDERGGEHRRSLVATDSGPIRAKRRSIGAKGVNITAPTQSDWEQSPPQPRPPLVPPAVIRMQARQAKERAAENPPQASKSAARNDDDKRRSGVSGRESERPAAAQARGSLTKADAALASHLASALPRQLVQRISRSFPHALPASLLDMQQRLLQKYAPTGDSEESQQQAALPQQ